VINHRETAPEGYVGNLTFVHSPYTGFSGNPTRNYALSKINLSDEDWVYILDDDNIIHPDWYSTVLEYVQLDFNMLGWGQLWKNGQTRLNPPDHPDVGNIDTACYMVKGSVMKNLKFKDDYVADGILAKEAYQFGKYLKIQKYISYYNYLRG
jgi:hypothetical protein